MSTITCWPHTSVKGFDLCTDILGKISLGDMAFLEHTDRLPTPQESVVFNAIAVTLVAHGITPSALAARMTYSGSPEAMQAAVGAGLVGHLREGAKNPMAWEVKMRADEEATAHMRK